MVSLTERMSETGLGCIFLFFFPWQTRDSLSRVGGWEDFLVKGSLEAVVAAMLFFERSGQLTDRMGELAWCPWAAQSE